MVQVSDELSKLMLRCREGGSGHGAIWNTAPIFVWKDWGRRKGMTDR